ncbi:MAG: GNAT family N-acetyltransferase [Chloroflexota bacterium]
MKTDTAFYINSQAYSVRRLSLADSQAIQVLHDQCLDFMLLVDVHPAGPNAGAEEFEDLPPGKSQDDHFVFGIADQQDNLVGLLDAVRGYPDETTWWVGLLLLAPEVRSQGLGPIVLQGFNEFVRSTGGQAVMLGVVEQNRRAYKFWSRIGFDFVRETEPRQFGYKTQTVIIMRRLLPPT